MNRLTVVPCERGATAHLSAGLAPNGVPPEPGPVDEVTRARLRRLIAAHLGDFPSLDLHLGLLDARGAWYAERVLGAWTKTYPDSFFGLVRHVVRTQLAGLEVPDPDLETWLAAGVPPDPVLQERWSTLNTLRYPSDTLRAASLPRGAAVSPSVARLDAILLKWPDELFQGFVLAYAKLEQVLERRSRALPPIDR